MIIALASLLLLSACGNSRDLSTPSSRLVGHWKSKGFTKAEYYFSPVGEKTGEGKQTEYDPRDGTVFICNYTVSSETPEGENLRIYVSCQGYEEFAHFTEFVIQKDGLTAKMHNFTIEYIDLKTEYEPEK